jgi:translocation and assembly module TamB
MRPQDGPLEPEDVKAGDPKTADLKKRMRSRAKTKTMDELQKIEEKLHNMEAKVKRSLATRIGRFFVIAVGALLLLIVIMVGALAWYTTTGDFQRRVGKQVVSILENTTGGRVQLREIRFSLRHLAVEADDLVIHGLEGPGEPPYLAAEKIQFRVKLFNFLQHTTGSGLASHVSLSYLRVDKPQVHLIIDKDGKTNQPIPKHPKKSNASVTDTLLDLKAKRVELANGLFLLNDRAIPFEMAAGDLNVKLHYVEKGDLYAATVDLNDLRTKMMTQPEAQSQLHVEAELGRDTAQLKKFEFHSGKSSVLTATASLAHFAKPEWDARAQGSLELKQISILTGTDGLNAGTVDLELNGHNCTTTPAVAQKHPRFWQRTHPKKNEKPSTTVLPPDPDCTAGYLLVGKAKIHNASYKNQYVRLHDVNGGGQLHITPTELLLTALSGTLPGGGSAEGRLRISNWLGQVAASAPAASATMKGAVATANKTSVAVTGEAAVTGPVKVPLVQSSHAYLDATLTKVPLRTIMDITAPTNYGDLGFDMAIGGPVKVEWGGPAADIADTVEVDGDLTATPTGVKRRGALSDIPVTGQVLAHYTGKTEVVQIQRLVLQTPQSNLEGSGVLGVNLGDRLTALRVDLVVRDLGEYDQLLQTLGLTANGKTGTAAIPVVLHGAMVFNGTAKGAIQDLDVKGHLEATSVEAKLSDTLDVFLDSVVADAEYSPFEGLAVASSTIHRGTAVLNLGGTVRPRRLVSRRGVPDYAWDDASAIDVTLQLANAKVTDVLQIAGQQGSVPVTGMMEARAHAVGTIKSFAGSGHVTLNNGVAYGEPYESAAADLAVQGRNLEATHLVVNAHGMQVAGNGGYDLDTKHLHGHLEGNRLQLSKFQIVQKSNAHADGVLSFVADANGTVTEPGLTMTAKLEDVRLKGQAVGDATADMHSQGKMLRFSANSNLVGAKVNATGQVDLTGNYDTQSKLTFAGLDLNKLLAIFAPGKIALQTSLGGVVTVNGPLRTPNFLSGRADFNDFDLKLQGIELKTAEPLQLSLQNGVMRLEQVHITGQDTDLKASGTAQVFGVGDPQGGKLDVKATGSLNTALLHTFDPDILSTGKVEFSVTAGGQVMNPALTGKVQFDKVNASIDGVPNGLSNMNGTLVFNQDRLQVQTLTAMTGGGLLKIGGSIRYRNGVYADLTATGDVVRVRYNGLSATANANFKLQGSPDKALLSGNILLTRFGVGANVDFAALGGMGGVAVPPDPNAPANKVQLDVRVTSSPQLDFQNSYAKLSGTVDLTIRGTLSVPAVLGRIQITDGSATFAGTKYQLQRGDIYFTNPVRIDPIIDLDATARVESYDITIGLHGTATSLKPTYRSEPPLSEADVFALLALGRTQEEAQIYQEQQVQAGTNPTTSSLLGGALNATVSSRVEKLFGVGSVKIDPAFVGTLGSSSARITVQQQISRQITATFATNVNTSAQQLIQLQYDVNRNMSIVATRDETGVFSLVYKLRSRYR